MAQIDQTREPEGFDRGVSGRQTGWRFPVMPMGKTGKIALSQL